MHEKLTRRRYILAGASTAAIGLGGCLGDTDDEAEPAADDGGDDPNGGDQEGDDPSGENGTDATGDENGAENDAHENGEEDDNPLELPTFDDSVFDTYLTESEMPGDWEIQRITESDRTGSGLRTGRVGEFEAGLDQLQIHLLVFEDGPAAETYLEDRREQAEHEDSEITEEDLGDASFLTAESFTGMVGVVLDNLYLEVQGGAPIEDLREIAAMQLNKSQVVSN